MSVVEVTGDKKRTARDALPPAPVPPTADGTLLKSSQTQARSVPRLAEQVPSSILLALSPTEIQRQEILYELMETERQYVKDLESLARDYLKPLRRLNLLTSAQLEEIFCNIDQVIDCNSELLAEFEKQKKVSSLLLGDVGKSFHARSTLFKVYSIYCANQPVASTALEEIRAKNTNFDQAIKELSTAPQVRFTSLENVLILPVQRLYKYPLFLENLLHYTPPSHRDYESIQKGLTDIREIAELVDAKVTEVHRVKKLRTVQAALHPKFATAVEIIVPGRHLLGEFSVKQNAALWGKSRRTSKAMFFNDGLLLSQKSQKGLKVQRWLGHDEYALKESATQSTSIEVAYVGGATDAWQCDSEGDRKALLTLAQQLCTPQIQINQVKNLLPASAPANPKTHKRGEGNGSRSLSLRNVRLLLEKDSIGSVPQSNSTPSAAASATSPTLSGSGNNSSTLAAQMRFKLLEWRNLVDSQGSELANERKMRIALEQKVLSLMDDLAQERRSKQHLEKIIRANGLDPNARPPSPPSKPLPTTPEVAPLLMPVHASLSAPAVVSSSVIHPSSHLVNLNSTSAPLINPPLPQYSAPMPPAPTGASAANFVAISLGVPRTGSSSTTSAAIPFAVSASSMQTPTKLTALTSLPLAPSSARGTISSPKGLAVSPRRSQTTTELPNGVINVTGSPVVASSVGIGNKSPGRTRHTIHQSPRIAVPPLATAPNTPLSSSGGATRASQLIGRISFFESVTKTHEEKQIILSPRGEKEKEKERERSRSAKRMTVISRDEIKPSPEPSKGRLTRTISADQSASAARRDTIVRK